jgi:hypothetical protein
MGKSRRAGGKVAVVAERTGSRSSHPDQPAAAPAPWLVALTRAAPLLVFAAGTIGLLGFHGSSFFSSWTDENVHVYVARRVSEGLVLYRDIDSARPPLVILPLAALMRLGLAPLLAARTMVVLGTLATAVVIFVGARRLFSLRAALVAVALYLLAPESIARPQYTGIHLVQLGSTLSLVLALLGRPLGAGAVFGLALGAGQHSVIIGGLAGLWSTYRERRQGVLFAAGFVGAMVVVFGVARLLGGQHLWENLIARHLYHLGGPALAEKTDFGMFLAAWLGDHLLIFALAAAALFGPQENPGDASLPQRRAIAVRVLVAAVVLHLAVVLVMSGAQFLYVIPTFSLICLLAGAGADQIIGWVAKAAAGDRLMRAGGAAVGSVAVMLLGWKIAQDEQKTSFLPVLPLFPYTRSAELVHVQKLDVIKTIARDLNRKLAPGETLFGHPPVVALTALESGHRVAGELADLAPRWIEQKIVTPAFVISKIEGDGVGAVVTPLWQLVQNPQFRAYLATCYERPERYPRPAGGDGRGIPDLYVFLRKKAARPCLPDNVAAAAPPTGG